MKKILVPIDFSENSMEALMVSLQLAIKLEASVEVIHVYRPIIVGEEMPYDIAELLLEQKQDEAIAAFIEHVKTSTGFSEFLDVIPMSFTLKAGFALDNILYHIKEENIDLVVMGTTGNTGLNKILGNLAGEILENASCSVLVVPKDTSFVGIINKIGVAISFELNKDKPLINTAINWAEPFDADIECFHVDLRNIGDYHDKIVKCKNEFCNNRLGFYIMNDDRFMDGVASYYKQNTPNLIVLASTKRNFIKEWFHKNLAKEITMKLNVPILVFQIP